MSTSTTASRRSAKPSSPRTSSPAPTRSTSPPSLTAGGPATILLTQGELKITDDFTITGPGASVLTIDASGNDSRPDFDYGHGSRIFNVDDGMSTIVDVIISDLKLTGGDVTGSGGAISSTEKLTLIASVISGNSAGKNLFPEKHGGGGIFSSGDLTIIDCSILANSNFIGPAFGSGIFAVGNTLTIIGSTISNNSANIVSIRGGGVFSSARMTTVIDSDFISNRIQGTSAFGAGLYCDGEQLTIECSTFAENRTSGTGSGGAGLVARAASSRISASTISGNQVTGTATSGGGILAGGGQVSIAATSVLNNTVRGTSSIGGGIVSTAMNLQVINCTISGNTTTGGFGNNGGGIWIRRLTEVGSALISHSTIVNNSAADGGGIFIRDADVIVNHSVVAKNIDLSQSGGTAPDLAHTSTGTFAIVNSLLGDNRSSGFSETPIDSPGSNGNLIGGPIHGAIDPLLGPLADNGGPTLTHALLQGSPAINAGDLNAQAGVGGVPLYDQRGEPLGRVFGGRIDIGAFEYQATSDLNLLVDTLVDESDGDYSRGDLSLREAIELANLWPSSDKIHFDPALTAAGSATIPLIKGELKITDDVTITGPGANLLTIDASGNDPTPGQRNGDGGRHFNIDDGTSDLIEVSISDVTLTGSTLFSSGRVILDRENLSLSRVSIVGDTKGGNYVIAHFLGLLQLSECTISGNFGGAINSSGGDVEIANSTFADNFGLFTLQSCIYVIQGDLTLTHSTISDNGPNLGVTLLNGKLDVVASTISGNAGGIFSRNAEVHVADSNILDNMMSGGISEGGIGVDGGSLSVVRSNIAGNSARSNVQGGGIWTRNGATLSVVGSHIANNDAPFGGGIRISEGTASIVDSTIAGNTSDSPTGSNLKGAGIDCHSADLTIVGSTISGNSGRNSAGVRWSGTATFEIRDSLIENNYFGILVAPIRGAATIRSNTVTGNVQGHPHSRRRRRYSFDCRHDGVGELDWRRCRNLRQEFFEWNNSDYS